MTMLTRIGTCHRLRVTTHLSPSCSIFFLFWICSIVSITIATISVITTKSTPVDANILGKEEQQSHHQSRRKLATLGIDSCACSPQFYEFTLDLSLNCNTDITYGDGVVLTQCTIISENPNSTNDNSTDLLPTTITTINITELDQNLNIIQKDSIYVPLNSGDTFSYSSVTSNYAIWNDTADGDIKLLPRALQLTLVGINRNNIPIIFTGVIVYMDDCNIDSTILVNSTIGWVKLTKTTEALEEFCPFVKTNVNGTNIPSLSPAGVTITTIEPTLIDTDGTSFSTTRNNIADVTTLPSISTITTIKPTTTMMSSPSPSSSSLTLQPSSIPSSMNVDSILPTPLLSTPTTKIMSMTPTTSSSSSSPFPSSTFNRLTKNPASNTRPTNPVTPTILPHNSNSHPPDACPPSFPNDDGNNKNNNMNSVKGSGGGGMSGNRAMGKGGQNQKSSVPNDYSVSNSDMRNVDDYQEMTKPLNDYLPGLFRSTTKDCNSKKLPTPKQSKNGKGMSLNNKNKSDYGNGNGKGNTDPQFKRSPSSTSPLKNSIKDRPDQLSIKKKHPPALHSMPPNNADNNDTIIHFDDNALENNHAAGLSGNTGIEEGKTLMKQNYYNKSTSENDYGDQGHANILNSNNTTSTSMASATTTISPISASNNSQYDLYRVIIITSIGCSVIILLIIVTILFRQKHRAYIKNQNNIRQEKAWNITQGLLL